MSFMRSKCDAVEEHKPVLMGCRCCTGTISMPERKEEACPSRCFSDTFVDRKIGNGL